jgi:hypothetical protein
MEISSMLFHLTGDGFSEMPGEAKFPVSGFEFQSLEAKKREGL